MQISQSLYTPVVKPATVHYYASVWTKFYVIILREFVSKTCNHIPSFTLIRLWQLATLYDMNIYTYGVYRVCSF